MTSDQLDTLALWYRERSCYVQPWLCMNALESYARCIGIEMTPSDSVTLFHHINEGATQC
jgi:hypothetical protein